MVNPRQSDIEPIPGGNIPSDVPPAPPPDELPDIGPTGPRTPYPVNDPGITRSEGTGLGARLPAGKSDRSGPAIKVGDRPAYSTTAQISRIA